MSHPSSTDSDLELPNLPNLPEFSELWKTSLNWQPSPEQFLQLQALYHQVWLGNQTLNLTRILQPQDFWEKHLWDSLVGIASFLQDTPEPMPLATPLPNPVMNLPSPKGSASTPTTDHLSQSKQSSLKLIDVGTGGGFPGLPIAIARPDWSVTLLDATEKKVNFLRHVQAELRLSQVHTLVGRAEAVGRQQQRAAYDMACIRAVGSVSVCAEYTLPLLKIGGLAILYRGQWTPAEADTLAGAATQLGGTVEKIEQVFTPLSQSVRHLIYLRKHQATPNNYPRAIGIPSQDPL